MIKIYNLVCKDQKLKHKSRFSLFIYQLIHISKKWNINYLVRISLKKYYFVKKIIAIVNFDIFFNQNWIKKIRYQKKDNKLFKKLNFY